MQQCEAAELTRANTLCCAAGGPAARDQGAAALPAGRRSELLPLGLAAEVDALPGDSRQPGSFLAGLKQRLLLPEHEVH